MTLLIAIGIFNLIAGNRIAGIILIGIGTIFLLDDMYFFDFDWQDYWPIIIIIVGLAFILRHRTKTLDRNLSDSDFFDDVNIFGGSEKKFVSQNLQVGKVTNIFGGSTIDLRESKLSNGAFIEVFTMFGGCDILVPADWNVHIDTVTIFGGVTDKRENTASVNGPELRIRGLTLFGGGDIKTSK